MMLRPALFNLVFSVLARAFVVDIPPPSGQRGQSSHPTEDPSEWRLDALPDPDTTDHLVFDTVHSLLQHWPNTRMRNGHNIVPGIIPEGTLLYHGSDVRKLPRGPEWYGFNPEHSHYFCRETVLVLDNSQPGCWLFTVATTRPLKIIYFDGSSAAKLPWGTLDTQDLLAWGEERPQDMWLELPRADALCRWAKKNGVDGFIRMEMAFELLACDFTSGVTVVSAANIVRPLTVKPIWCECSSDDLLATNWRSLWTARPMFEVLTAGSWQNRFPGETRIQLDLASLISFYDTELMPSLVPFRAGLKRWDHRASNVSRKDLSATIARLETSLTRPAGWSSRIDWSALFQVVVDRYAGRLAVTRHLVNSPVPTAERFLDLVRKVQTQLRIMLTPYLLVYATPAGVSDGGELDWATPVYKLCATAHTRALHAVTDSERLLLRAVRGTNREICRVVTKMWAEGVHVGIDPSLQTKAELDMNDLSRVWQVWKEDLNWLVAWLDWGVWVKCEPECSPEEICFLPTWPVDFPHFPKPSKGDDRPWWDANMPDSDAWVRPQPMCKSRVDDFPW